MRDPSLEHSQQAVSSKQAAAERQQAGSIISDQPWRRVGSKAASVKRSHGVFDFVCEAGLAFHSQHKARHVGLKLSV